MQRAGPGRRANSSSSFVSGASADCRRRRLEEAENLVALYLGATGGGRGSAELLVETWGA